MLEELKTRTVKLETYDRDTPLMIVGHLQATPRVKIIKTEWTKTTPSSRKTLSCETSRNVKRVFVNLMPILAAARESVEEEESTGEEDESSANEKKTEASARNRPSLAKEQSSSSEVELPPISVQKPAAPQSDCQTDTRARTSLPPIRPSPWNKPAKSTGELADSKPVTEEPVFSVS